jgi:uncharacterized protein YkwD
MTHDNFSQNCDALGQVGSCGENILFNFDKSAKTMAKTSFEQWKASPEHYDNMVSVWFTKFGAGFRNCPKSEFSKIYWTQMFWA